MTPAAAAPASWTGAFFAAAAGLLWGLVFVTPLWLPDYPATLLSFGRYLAFGLLALPLALADRPALRELTRADWREALRLALVGNLLYYLFLAAAIQRAGAPLPTLIIGTLPVVIALAAQVRGRRRGGAPPLPIARLLPSLLLIGLGIVLVNHTELRQWPAGGAASDHGLGALLALGALVCWTWYPLRNADWLRAHPGRSPRSWATAQGLATLPLAALGYLLTCVTLAAGESPLPLPFGPRPALFIGVMVTVGLLASWLGTLCWNEASRRLPPSVAGQLIVFETLAALAYAFLLRGQAPSGLALLGIVLLLGGVLWALRSAAPPPPPGSVP